MTLLSEKDIAQSHHLNKKSLSERTFQKHEGSPNRSPIYHLYKILMLNYYSLRIEVEVEYGGDGSGFLTKVLELFFS